MSTSQLFDPALCGAVPAFAESADIGPLERSEVEVLPLMLVEGEMAFAGRYPSRTELACPATLTFDEKKTHFSCQSTIVRNFESINEA